jgi:hypothetical protein
MIAERIPQLQELSIDEKRLLAAELWEEANQSDFEGDEPPTPELREAIRERIAYNMAHPEEFRSWEEVKARLKRVPHS